jgi:PKD repeat protein
MLSAHAVGDVYEIKGADFLTAKLKSFGKTVNVNSKAAPNAGPFYGDEIKFTTDFSGATPPSVTWNFGDNIQQTVTPGTTGAPDVTHQYGGLSVVQLPATMNVTATSAADSSMTHSINMTLAKPAVRVGVANTSILFTQGTTDLTLPIVTSDLFYDGSDGAVEGHYSEWKLATDTASTKAAPNQTFGVGGLGDRELTFTGHYGPYTANFTNTADAPLSITPIKYKVRAFVPVVNGPLASGGNVVFKSATRVTTNTAHLLNGGATVVVYKWEILNAAGAPVGTAVTGSAAISAIPDFSLPRSSFAGAQNWKARLSLTTVDNTTETALSIALNGPTPAAIVAIGCTNIGSPCSFTVSTSVPANDPSTWTYAWSATGIATLPGGSSATYAPTFAVAGAYSITVLVSNALGDAPALALPVSLGQPLCSSSPTTANTAITCKGRTSGCVAGFSNCTAGETIDFWINTQGWTASDCDNFTWSWGDGTAPSTTQGPSHAYTSAGSYTVTLIVDGGLSDAQVSKVVTVGNTGGGGGNGNGGGGNGNGGGGGGGGTGACTILAPPINVFATWTGATSGCNALTNCSTGEAIGFKMGANGYNYDCGPHSFTYHFGDGSADQTTFSPTQVVNHTYTTAGPFTLEVLITNGSSSATASHTVKVVAGSGGGGGNGNGGGGNGNGGGGSGTGCSDMNPPTNVYMNYSGPTSGCTSVVGTCAASENINFSLGVQGYNLDCTTHTYEWDFGDGTPKSTDKNATHAYTQGGDYPVSLKINRLDGKTATISRTVKVAGGNSCPNMVAGENIIVVFFGAKSKCTLGGGTCQEDESLSFGLIGGYNFSCSTHTLEWDFGDGTPKGNGQSPSHAYAKGGDYHGTVKIKNSKQEISVPFDIKIPVTPTRTRSARH